MLAHTSSTLVATNCATAIKAWRCMKSYKASRAWSAFDHGHPEPALIDQLDQEEGLKLIKRALAGDALVDAALCDLGAVLIFTEAPMPKRLRGYLAFRLLRRQSEGVRPRRALAIRDTAHVRNGCFRV